MLAKQFGRLVNDAESLFYKVFKAKYFPNGTTFDAKASSGSYAWKSILRARKVISMGARWRVGDGNQIRIFEDRWLPFEGSGKIISPCWNLHRDVDVSSLIDNDMAARNSQIIDASFLPFEACKIKAIPFSSVQQADRLCRPWDKSGEYTVKTGYKIMCDEDVSDSASTSNDDSIVKFWRSMWKFNIPGKIKHFLWKACFDALPTKTNLLKRKILMDAVCPLCSKEPKSVVHALWSCEVI